MSEEIERKAVLAVDPSFRCTGWVLFEDGKPQLHGTIRTKSRGKKLKIRKGSADIQDILFIQKKLQTICYQHPVRIIVAEEPAGSTKGTRGTKALAYAVTIIAGLDGYLGYPVIWIRYDEAKEVVAGEKTATKLEVRAKVCARWPMYDFKRPQYGGRDLTLPEIEAIGDAAAVYWAASELDPTVKLIHVPKFPVKFTDFRVKYGPDRYYSE